MVIGPAAGILEFMAPNFIKTFYPFINDTSIQLKDFTSLSLPPDAKVVEVPCLPLQRIFDAAGVSHINFFVLDVEGGGKNIFL